MKKNTSFYSCTLCGDPKGEPFDYYTAKKVGSSTYVSQGVMRQTTTRTVTYRDVTRHTGYVCKKCRTKGRLKTVLILLAIMAAIGVGCSGPWGAAFSERLPVLYGILTFIFFILIFAVIGALFPRGGSEMLIRHAKDRSNPYGLTFLTPGEASRLQRK